MMDDLTLGQTVRLSPHYRSEFALDWVDPLGTWYLTGGVILKLLRKRGQPCARIRWACGTTRTLPLRMIDVVPHN